MTTAACSTLLAAALLCNAPAVPAPITLHGAPIFSTVEVYRLAAPAVTPVAASDPEPEPSAARSRAKGLIWVGALIGGMAGCPIGAYLSKHYNDDAHTFNCFLFAGVGAGLGAVAVADSVL